MKTLHVQLNDEDYDRFVLNCKIIYRLPRGQVAENLIKNFNIKAEYIEDYKKEVLKNNDLFIKNSNKSDDNWFDDVVSEGKK